MRSSKVVQIGALLGALSLAAASWIPSARAAGPVTVSVWTAYNGAQAAAINTLAQQFMAKYPNIKIETVSSANYGALLQKEQSAIFAGNAPVLMQAYENWVAQFVKSDAIENLAPYIKGKNGLKTKEVNDFFPGMWRSGLYGKQRLMMPFSKSDVVMYFNGAMLHRYGIKTAPKTWTELAKDCKKLLVLESGRPSQWCATVAADTSNWYVMEHEWGNSVLDKSGKPVFGNKSGAAPVAFMTSLLTKKYFVLTTSNNFQDQADLQSGKSAFAFGSSAGLPFYIRGAKPGVSIGEAVFPAGPKGQKTDMYGAPMVINKKASADEKNAAWLFLKFITEPVQTAYWAMNTGYMPVRKSALKLPIMVGYYKANPQQHAPLQQINNAVFEPPLPWWDKARTDVSTALTSAYSLNKTPLESMKQAADQLRSDASAG